MSLCSITDSLVAVLDALSFAPPVAHVYNPLVYAREPWNLYVDRFGTATREVVLLGMNPGPWGMVQTGVPFGEIVAVRDWMDIVAPVLKPAHEHPKRPIDGFACHRSEVSGRRLWGWAQELFGTPDAFFAQFFVANYCPLAFMEASGRNLTPDKLPAAEREPLFAACDQALRETVELMQPELVVGIGKFAETRARAALKGVPCRIGTVLHPSPANPAANRGWSQQATDGMRNLGVVFDNMPAAVNGA
jgi:single-strand selective monofunctional uracil DNA glycosylase